MKQNCDLRALNGVSGQERLERLFSGAFAAPLATAKASAPLAMASAMFALVIYFIWRLL